MCKYSFLFFFFFYFNIGYAQITSSESEIVAAFDYYKKTFKLINSAFSNAEMCSNTEDIEDKLDYLYEIEDDVEDAISYVKKAIDEVEDAKSKIEYYECSDAINNIEDSSYYFEKSKRRLNDAYDEVNSIDDEDSENDINNSIGDISNYLEDAATKLNHAIDDLKNTLNSIRECANIMDYNSYDSCEDLLVLIQEHGNELRSVSSYRLDSEWLKSVSLYSYDEKLFVEAEIFDNTSRIFATSYIFCDIPEDNWNSFSRGYSDSYGERFHKYIIDYVCNCE